MAEPLRHAEPHHHPLRGLGDLFEVVGGAGSDLAEDDLLGGAATKRHRHRVGQLSAASQELVLSRQADRVAERLAAADDRDLVDRVAVGQQVADDRVAELVVGGDQRSFSLITRVFFSGPAITRMIPSSSSCMEISRLPVRAVSSAASLIRLARSAPVKPGVWPASVSRSIALASGLPRVWTSRIFLAAFAVGAVDDDLAVEAAGPQQRRVEDVGAVGSGDQDDVVFHLEAVHLDQELVQRLLALVVTATHSGPAMAAYGVDLVHEDDAGRVLFGLLEEVADAAGANADEHLDEVRPGDREEGHAGLAGDGAGEQRLAGAGRAVEQNALGDAGTKQLEFLRVLEEFLDLL